VNCDSYIFIYRYNITTNIKYDGPHIFSHIKIVSKTRIQRSPFGIQTIISVLLYNMCFLMFQLLSKLPKKSILYAHIGT